MADSPAFAERMRRPTTYTGFLLAMRPVRILVSIAFVGSAAMLSGCLYAGGRTVREVGPQLSAEAVAFVEPGQTPVDHVLAAFGEPHSRVCTSDGTEILRYDCDVRTTEGSYLLMLIASSNNTIERTCWWFEVREERVLRVWGEKLPPSERVAPSTTLPLASSNEAVELGSN